MSEIVRPIAEWGAAVVELLGVGIITLFALYALAEAVFRLLKGGAAEKVFHEFRQRLGRSILLGLELLIAADIIHTVAVDLNFETVGVLALVVLIRTFLSFSLELELTGKWPWQQGESAPPAR